MSVDRLPQREPGSSWLSAAGLAWLCTAALTTGALLAWSGFSDAPLDAVIRASGGERATEGRLTHFPYAAVAVPVRGTSTQPARWQVLAAAGLAKERSDAVPDAPNLQAYGAAALQAGSLDIAVQAFEDAAVADPRSATIESDLSAAYLARSQTPGHAIDAPRAIEAAARAQKLNPRLASAAFNYALALHRLRIRHEATRAWDAYLERFGLDDGWAEEARKYRAELIVAPPSVPAAQTTDADARLGAWARAVLSATETAVVPDFAADDAFHAAIGVELAESRGARRRVLAEVVRDLLAAEGALATPNYSETSRLVAAILTRPIANESPLRLWAMRLQMSAGFNTGTRMDRQAVEALAETARRLRFTALEGDARYRLGALDYVAGRYERAYEHYRVVLTVRESQGNVRAAVASRTAMADALRMLGRESEAWEGYRANLLAGGVDDPSLESVRLMSPASWALDSGRPAVALVFAREAEHLARSIDHPGLVTYAVSQQARALQREGNAAAAATINRAREALRSIYDEGTRNRLMGEIVQAEAELLACTSPAMALTVAADAERHLAPNAGQGLLALSVMQARVHRSLGDFERARTALLKGVALVEVQQEAIGQEEFLPSFIDASWDVFSEFVDLEATAMRHGEALRWLDRGFDIRRRWSRSLPATAMADTSRLGPLVTYLARPDALWIWVVRDGQITARRVTVSRDSLIRNAARLAHVLTLDGAPDALSDSVAAMARDIWWPIAGLLGADSERPARVSLVLDPVLQRVPFALLPWQSGDHARVVDITAMVMCASLFACRDTGGPVGPGVRVTALHAGQGGQGLAALPTARGEAERVGRRYDGARVGPATEAALSQALTTSDVVHFSGHAVADERYPRRSELLLATDTGDGVRVPLSRLLRQGVQASLIVLSACRTSRAEARRGEGGIGIAGEFLRSGARQVLATNWDVRDDVAGLAMDLIHEALAAGAAPWDAVRHAQLAIRRDVSRSARDWAGYVAYTSVVSVEQSTN